MRDSGSVMPESSCPHCGANLGVAVASCPRCGEPIHGLVTRPALTRRERALLTAYRRYRSSPPTAAGMMLRFAPVQLATAALFGGMAYLAYSPGGVLPWFILGAFVGMVSRDLGIFLKAASFWPALAAIIDWPKLDAILDDDLSRPTGADTAAVQGPTDPPGRGGRP